MCLCLSVLIGWQARAKYRHVLGDEQSAKDTLAGLNSAKGFIKNRLAKSINLRNTPQITFVLDQSIEYGIAMSKKID
ncbi:MAG: 30S ribosome-binding factor RbfA, partial [Alistipes sp.]|nr:30S ribosome-binding factor RbfA [Alistipes sp.]